MCWLGRCSVCTHAMSNTYHRLWTPHPTWLHVFRHVQCIQCSVYTSGARSLYVHVHVYIHVCVMYKYMYVYSVFCTAVVSWRVCVTHCTMSWDLLSSTSTTWRPWATSAPYLKYGELCPCKHVSIHVDKRIIHWREELHVGMITYIYLVNDHFTYSNFFSV